MSKNSSDESLIAVKTLELEQMQAEKSASVFIPGESYTSEGSKRITDDILISAEEVAELSALTEWSVAASGGSTIARTHREHRALVSGLTVKGAEHAQKVVPARITAVAIHPSETRTLVAAGAI